MGSNFGKISIFGESHGECIGVVIDGFPAGIPIDNVQISKDLLRRAGGRDELSTPRAEKDNFRVVSGIFEGHSTGAPICIIIPNEDTRSKDYLRDIARPNHADYTAFVRYSGFNDYRGSGHFSGRLTAALVAAGSIAKQYLATNNVFVGAHVYSIGDAFCSPLSDTDDSLPTGGISPLMHEQILAAKANSDSIGGVVEVKAIGVPVGFGDPMFNAVESVLSHILFAIPAVKGVEFGAGFDVSKMRGSEANDPLYIDGTVKTSSNTCGGICGGITNGMPIIARVAFKPTPSIGIKQQSINMKTMQPAEIEVSGRHDPCIVPRAVPVVEAAVAIGLLEVLHG